MTLLEKVDSFNLTAAATDSLDWSQEKHFLLANETNLA